LLLDQESEVGEEEEATEEEEEEQEEGEEVGLSANGCFNLSSFSLSHFCCL
jgi:hypothetical protein